MRTILMFLYVAVWASIMYVFAGWPGVAVLTAFLIFTTGLAALVASAP